MRSQFLLIPLFALQILTISSCSFFWKNVSNNSDVKTVKSNKENQLHLIFGGSINGETHPCGCRHFPLGGLSSLAGVLDKFKKDHGEFVYLDTGDMLFPSNNIPAGVKRSVSFMAQNVFRGMNLLGVNYMVLGDYDLSEGPEFINQLLENSPVQLLVANLSPTHPFKKVKPWTKIQSTKGTIYIIGVANPDVFPVENQHYFISVEEGFKKALKEIDRDGFEKDQADQRLILLSHSGMEFDQSFVKDHPEINWVVGGHSQSFTRLPFESGKTNLVQVLSKNHYLGHITFDFEKGASGDQYELLEIRQELEALLNPNPMISFLSEHKKQVSIIQAEEQAAMVNHDEDNHLPLATANSCLECHAPQYRFWEKTPHSLAYLTLKKAKEENNLTCVQCHSLGLNNPRGFNRVSDMVDLKNKKVREQYWRDIFKIGAVEGQSPKPIRERSGDSLAKTHREWDALDKKLGVAQNYANVQCLNCHNQPTDHPFTMGRTVVPATRKGEIKEHCLNCHTPDQSPEWYSKNKKGLPEGVNEAKFQEMYKKLSCPRHQS